MANNVFQVKRTTVSGRTPNTTGSYVTNTQYIAAGEFALNMADGILYSSNGSSVITVGSNLVNQKITGNLTVKAIIANSSLGLAGQVLFTNSTGVYWDTVGGTGTVTSVATGNGMTGGPITTTGTVSILANSGIIANATGVFVNGNTGLITNTTGVHVLANSGIIANSTGTFVNGNTGVVVNATGVHVNSTYINTIAANSATFVLANNGIISNSTGVFVNGNNGLITNTTGVHVRANSGIIANATGVFVNGNTGVVVNSTGVFVNATYIGTISANNASFLGGVAAASYVNTSGAYTISGIHTYTANLVVNAAIIAGGVNGTAGQVLTSNGTGNVYWSTITSNSVYVKGGAATIGTLASEGTNIFRVNANTLNYNTTISTGENAQATGPISVAPGITLTVESGARVVII